MPHSMNINQAKCPSERRPGIEKRLLTGGMQAAAWWRDRELLNGGLFFFFFFKSVDVWLVLKLVFSHTRRPDLHPPTACLSLSTPKR